MIYTIGRTEVYLQGFEDEKLPDAETFRKLGKTEDYAGGIVFKTKEEAEQYLVKASLVDYSVFGVEADWDKDTYLDTKDNTQSLLYTSRLVKI